MSNSTTPASQDPMERIAAAMERQAKAMERQTTISESALTSLSEVAGIAIFKGLLNSDPEDPVWENLTDALYFPTGDTLLTHEWVMNVAQERAAHVHGGNDQDGED